jgi:hypothetical protein
MNNHYDSNPAMKEQVFTTPKGKLVSWSTLLTVKDTVLKQSGNEITLTQALSLVDDCYNTQE